MSHNWIEPLEAKRLLTVLSSAVLGHGVLTITGTDNADNINFWYGAKNPLRLIVRDGVSEFSFERAGIRQIDVNALAGDDRVNPINVSGEVAIPMRLDGGAGDDRLVGGSGNDTLIGGDGNDDLLGGKGIDTADYSYVTSEFNSIVIPGPHGLIASLDGQPNDQTSDGVDNIESDIENIIGTQFRDVIVGNGQDNTLTGGGGPDILDGSNGNDLLVGGSGANSLIGGVGADTLIGGSGQSTLEGDSGNDSLIGGSGDETLAGGLGSDKYNGGGGFDTADFTGDARSFHLTFDGKANDGPGRDNDNFIEINQVITTSDNNQVDASNLSHGITFKTTGHSADITGTEFADTLSMEDGTILGLGGNDLLEGGLGGSTLKSVIDGGAGNDTINTGSGDDVLTGGRGKDSIHSSDGNDSVNGGPGNDTVRAGLGNDYIRGDGGVDHLYGEDGNDTILGQGNTNDHLFGGDGADTFIQAENDKGFVRDFEPGVDQLISPQ